MLRQHGILVNAVDTESFRERLRDADFYRDWRRSVGEEAWALIETKVGKVG
jgi:TRAP-type transport system periplasmic protein